jgi:hypothetical protein
MPHVPWKDRVNAALERTVGYQLSKPLEDRAWRVPSPERLNTLLVRAVGYQLSKPLADGTWRLPPASSRRLLTAPVFIFSAPRSGSTLLRVILGSHSGLYAPPELPLNHLEVRADTVWVKASLEGLELSSEELQHMLWDRVLADALQRGGKAALVVKTPSNVLIWERIVACWPDARFIFLLRHPAAVVASLHASWGAEWHPGETGSIEETVRKVQRYITAVEQARQALPGHTIRYEDLTTDPETEVRRLCGALSVPFEPAMLDYGRFDHAGFKPGLGDSSLSLRSGRIQPPAPLPDDIPADFTDICLAWGYPAPGDAS